MMEDFEAAIELNPRYALAYANWSEAHLNAGLFTQALTDLNKAINLDPANVETLRNRGKVRLKLGDREGATDDFRRADRIERSPGRITRDPEDGRQGFRSSHGVSRSRSM